MKRILTLCTAGLMLAMLPLLGHAQSEIFQKYSEKKEVRSVYISKAMIENNIHLFTQELYIGKVSGKLNSVQILSVSTENVRSELAKDVRDMLKKEKYELLMKQKSASSNSEFHMLRKGDKVSQFIMFVESGSRSKLVLLEGDMLLSDIQRIMQYQQVSDAHSSRVIKNGEALEPGSPEYDATMQKVEKALQGLDMTQLREDMEKLSKNLKSRKERLSQMRDSL